MAQKQTYRAIYQNREFKNKPSYLWLINLQQRRQEYTMKQRLCTGQSGQLHVKQ